MRAGKPRKYSGKVTHLKKLPSGHAVTGHYIIGNYNSAREGRYMLTKSGKNLEDMIKKAIDDHVIKNSEYEEIIELAHKDGKIDAHEKVLLQELNDLIADKSVKRLPG